MASLFLVLLACCAINLANGSDLSYSFPIHKQEVGFHLKRGRGPSRPAFEEKSHYWYGNFTVGDAKNVLLLLDTGSPYVIMNPGVYKPSADSKPYYFPNFTQGYEGINKAGTGTVTVSGDILLDHVSNGVMTLSNQTIGNITTVHVQGSHKTPTLGPNHSGAIGFRGLIGTHWFEGQNYSRRSGSWIYNLCRYNVISECRFGMAFGTNSKGLQIIGKLDKSLYKGELTRAASARRLYAHILGPWVTSADITLNNKIILRNQTISMDTGTTNIQAPLQPAKHVFHKLGYQYVTYTQETYTFVDAFYPCDKPPTLGLSIPSQHDLKHSKDPNMSKTAKIYNILKSEWPLRDNGNNNCTAVLSGSNVGHIPRPYNIDSWVIGQPFYQGHYVDHHFFEDSSNVAFADLRNPENVGG